MNMREYYTMAHCFGRGEHCYENSTNKNVSEGSCLMSLKIKSHTKILRENAWN